MPDKSFISLCIAGTLIFILFIFLHVMFIIHYRKRLNQHYEEKQKLLSANLEEGERMMNQIAKEVHDNIGQLSHLLRMYLRRIEKTTDREERSKLLSKTNSLTDQIIDHSNNISHSLNSDFIKSRGFSNVLQDDIEHIKASGKINCQIKFVGNPRPISPDNELIIYRIAQEALHNSLKHSNSNIISIMLFYKPDSFEMVIDDNGKGFDLSNIGVKGIGIANMKQRAKLLSGELSIIPTSGKGCRVSLTIPNIYTK